MKLRMDKVFLGMIAVLAAVLLVVPQTASAQGSGYRGNKAVYGGTTTASIIGSTAYVDATAFQGSSNDICAIIYNALATLPSTGGVVDARGVQNSTIANPLTCKQFTTPWVQGSGTSYTFIQTPATIILPAANICINTPWILPNGTRLFGAGTFGPYGTIIEPYYGGSPSSCSLTQSFSDPNSATTGSNILYLGFNGTPMVKSTVSYPSNWCPSAGCTGMEIKDIELLGEYLPQSGTITNGIYNGVINSLGTNINSGGSTDMNSIIDQVELSQIPGTSLNLGIGSNTNTSTTIVGNSYSNLSASPTNQSTGITDASSLCASLVQLNGTPYGVGLSALHGFSCTPSLNSSSESVQTTGITSDGHNINLQDMHFEALTTNGILIGSNFNSQGQVAININGAKDIATNTGGVVTLSAAGSGSKNVDVALLGIVSGCGVSGGCTVQPTTIYDQYLGQSFTRSASVAMANSVDDDRSVGFYVEGENFNFNPPDTPLIQSRFNSSPTYQTWAVGVGMPFVSSPAAPPYCKPGQLYSRTDGTSGSADTIYICTNVSTGGTGEWLALK